MPHPWNLRGRVRFAHSVNLVSPFTWGVYAVPETFVVDKRGVINHKVVGVITRAMVDERLSALSIWLLDAVPELGRLG